MNESSWKSLILTFEKGEENREKIVLLSRQIIKHSKLSIYASHRKEMGDAKKHIIVMKGLIKNLHALLKQASPDAINSARVAEQEFVEAACLLRVISGKEVPTHTELKVDPEPYMLGLADVVGELGRVSVHSIIANDYATALRMREIVTDIYGKFMNLNLRNSDLRRKVDAIKWELKKMEDTIVQLKVNGRI